jgi:hypothetical protein
MIMQCDDVRRKQGASSMLLVLLVACASGVQERDHGEVQALVGQGVTPLAGSPQQVLSRARCDTEQYYATVRELRQDTTMLVAPQDLLDSTIHDCQRLIANEQLGPLVALLVSPDLVANANFAAGAVVAEIRNYDQTPHDSLGIKPDLNCLWLRGSPESLEGWTARIFQPEPGRSCTDGVTGRGTNFDVIRRRHSEHQTPGFYPSTGRWMWGGARQGVGIRCGNAWCEFGPAGYTPPRPFNTPAEVPGWYDEQRLSYMSGNTLVLSGLVGRISPHSSQQNMPQHPPIRPRDVAIMTFTGHDRAALAAYRTKFRVSTIPPAGLRISHQHVVPGLRLHRVGANTRWRGVFYNRHTTHSGRGSVRWSWSDRDERAWYSCEEGCCTTDRLDL